MHFDSVNNTNHVLSHEELMFELHLKTISGIEGAAFIVRCSYVKCCFN